MSVFDKIIILSKRIAESLVKNEKSIDLEDSEFFSASDKSYILKNITNKKLINQRNKLSKKINDQADWNTVSQKINVPTRKLKIWRYAAAAVVVGFLAVGYVIKDDIFNNNIEINQTTKTTIKIEPGEDKATLTLEDGSTIALEKGNSYQMQNASSNGEELVYEAEKTKTKEIVYNYLTIPRGGQFFIKLSDGTKVWLNSESQLKYPVNFISGETREVELVYGEAYFDVSPSTDHHGAKFRVINDHQDIEVIGTEFNIKAYKDEANIYTTLVEGKVSINAATTNQILKPSQQANLDLNSSAMNVTTVNVYNETSWKDGVFCFRKKPLEEIMKVLSRWYDMEVNFVNPELKSAGFNGVLRKNLNIEDILKAIKNFNVIEDYEIIDNTVILK